MYYERTPCICGRTSLLSIQIVNFAIACNTELHPRLLCWGKKKICLFCDGQLWGAFVMWVNMTCSKSLQTWCAASAVYWYPIIHDAKGATLRSAACTVLNDKIMFRSPFTFDALKIFIYTYEWQNTGIDELIRLVFDCYYCMTWH